MLKQMNANMATTSSLSALHQTIQTETTVAISEAVDPLKNEMKEIRDRLSKLETSSSSSSSSPKCLHLLNSMDVSHRRVAFVGFLDSTTAAARLQIIEDFVKQHVGTNSFSTGNFPKGPVHNQT